MSFIKIGLAAIGSLIAFAASASAEVRYNGFPKLGYYIEPSAPAPTQSTTAGRRSVFDARADLPRAAPPVPQSPFRKGGINSRGT
ncbi:hypothetical protein [Bradyrhizobium sp. LMTR 3]|uniref:hypothetical protein n=1 Tax=Bradyrhizobium sp. LMTR 3 TaxID=189873 RepID=UPI001146CC44|nr:hypothetical protein [Bradyrhizobium sp. LMTR 3]